MIQHEKDTLQPGGNIHGAAAAVFRIAQRQLFPVGAIDLHGLQTAGEGHLGAVLSGGAVIPGGTQPIQLPKGAEVGKQRPERLRFPASQQGMIGVPQVLPQVLGAPAALVRVQLRGRSPRRLRRVAGAEGAVAEMLPAPRHQGKQHPVIQHRKGAGAAAGEHIPGQGIGSGHGGGAGAGVFGGFPYCRCHRRLYIGLPLRVAGYLDIALLPIVLPPAGGAGERLRRSGQCGGQPFQSGEKSAPPAQLAGSQYPQTDLRAGADESVLSYRQRLVAHQPGAEHPPGEPVGDCIHPVPQPLQSGGLRQHGLAVFVQHRNSVCIGQQHIGCFRAGIQPVCQGTGAPGDQPGGDPPGRIRVQLQIQHRLLPIRKHRQAAIPRLNGDHAPFELQRLDKIRARKGTWLQPHIQTA